MTLNINKKPKTSEKNTPFNPQILNPIFIVAKKTVIFNLCTIKRLIISIFFMVIVPLLTLVIVPLPPGSNLTEILGMILFIYTYGLVFPILISAAAAPLISEEVKLGTMLTLVSKPISRPGIVIGKFIALLLYSIIINITCLLILIIGGLAKSMYSNLATFFFLHFFYSLLLTIFFGGLTLGISCFFKRPRNVVVIPLFLIIFSFLIGMMIKQILSFGSLYPGGGSGNLYAEFQLYHFDISYHMGNFYKYLVDSFLPGISNGWGPILFMFGIMIIDPFPPCDRGGTCVPSISFTIDAHYYHPILSLIFLLMIGFLLIAGGIFFLKKRDIS